MYDSFFWKKEKKKFLAQSLIINTWATKTACTLVICVWFGKALKVLKKVEI